MRRTWPAYRHAATRLARQMLRAGWPGTRVLKSAVASGLAWSAATRLGDPAPLFAVFGALAFVINVLVLPPDYRQDARRATRLLAGELVVHLRTALADTVQPPTREEARAHFVAAGAAVQLAEELRSQTERAREALRFNPVLRYSPGRGAAP